jgi:hypothetical protein
MVRELNTFGSPPGSSGWDLCYLYVYPDHWPTPPTRAANHPAIAQAAVPDAAAAATSRCAPQTAEARAATGAAGSAIGAEVALPLPLVQGGFHTYCLLAYVVSPKGAQKLAHLVRTEEVCLEPLAVGPEHFYL